MLEPKFHLKKCLRCGEPLIKVTYLMEFKDFFAKECLYRHIVYCGKNLSTEKGDIIHFIFGWSDRDKE